MKASAEGGYPLGMMGCVEALASKKYQQGLALFLSRVPASVI